MILATREQTVLKLFIVRRQAIDRSFCECVTDVQFEVNTHQYSRSTVNGLERARKLILISRTTLFTWNKLFKSLSCLKAMALAQMEEDTRSLPEVIIHTSVLTLTTILSLTGNFLICLAFCRNRRVRTITNFYVMSLAVSDLLLATVFFPSHLVASGLRRWPFSYDFCQFTGFLTQFWAQLSLCILAVASINRYFCVAKPNKYPVYFSRKKTVVSILFIWVFSFLQTLFFTIATPVVYRWSPRSLYCQGFSSDERKEMISYVFFGFFFLVPVFLVVFCYANIYLVVRKHNTIIVPSLQQTNRPGITTLTAHEIKTSRILFAAVLGFCVCWTPLIVILFLVFGLRVPISSVALWVLVLLTTFSSWINPVIYGVMNRAMRREFKNILLCRKGN